MIIVRTARHAERAALLPIWRSAVEESHHFLTPADVDWYEPFVASYLQTAADLRVAARAEPEPGDARTAAEPLGFIAHEAGAIQMLFVTADAQGTGVGSALLASVRDDSAGPDGTGSLTVDVNEDNASGRRFYESRGFTVVSRSPLDDQGRPFPLLHLRLTMDA